LVNCEVGQTPLPFVIMIRVRRNYHWSTMIWFRRNYHWSTMMKARHHYPLSLWFGSDATTIGQTLQFTISSRKVLPTTWQDE